MDNNSNAKPAEPKRKLRPVLKLNTEQKTFNENEISVFQNSTNSYMIQNHPLFTDLTESASAKQHKFGKFFSGKDNNDAFEDYFYQGDCYYVTQKSNGKEMQDKYKARSVMENNNLAFFGVYDGHSTKAIAETLTQKLDDYFLEEFKDPNDIKTAINKAFVRIEKEVMFELQDGTPRGGSTAIASFIYRDELYVANLGDCRAVLFQESSFIELSNIHDFSNENERNSVENKGGTILNNRLGGELALSRSIGDVNFKEFMSSEPEIMTHKFTNKDEYLLLASDGFWNGLKPELCLDAIKRMNIIKNRMGIIKALGDTLMEEACGNIKTKKDNMTLIVISIQDYLDKRKFSF